MSVFPFTQKRINESTIIRKFSKGVSSADLEWHRDRQDRVVEVINGNGWMLQMDNQVPTEMVSGKSYFIESGNVATATFFSTHHVSFVVLLCAASLAAWPGQCAFVDNFS